MLRRIRTKMVSRVRIRHLMYTMGNSEDSGLAGSLCILYNLSAEKESSPRQKNEFKKIMFNVTVHIPGSYGRLLVLLPPVVAWAVLWSHLPRLPAQTGQQLQRRATLQVVQRDYQVAGTAGSHSNDDSKTQQHLSRYIYSK